MNRLIRAEARKLRSTRTFWLITLGVLMLIAGAVAAGRLSRGVAATPSAGDVG